MEQEKKYLKTIEEVSDALAAGKKIYNGFGKSFKKDKNGFLIYELKSGKKYFSNEPIFVEDVLYILEPKPLEVKLWHLYEDNFGDKVFIYYKGDLGKHPFIGMVKENKDIVYVSHNGEIYATNQKVFLVKELADLSKYFEK